MDFTGPCSICLTRTSAERESLISSHQTIPLLPPQAIPSIFTCSSLFSPFPHLLCYLGSILLSLFSIFLLHLYLSCPPISPSRGYFALILSTFSTQPLIQELREQDCGDRQRDMCHGWGGWWGHISLPSSPMEMLSYKINSLSRLFYPLSG